MSDDGLKALNLRNAFDRLITAVIRERAIPFIGAGVSSGAIYPIPGSEKPTSNDLTERLVKHLIEQAGSSEAAAGLLQGVLGGKDIVEEDLRRLGLAWLAEQVLNLDGGDSRKLCNLLEIERFTYLQPTKAHRYIAFLAREGRVHEVITTNYDCCLERAFKDSVYGWHECTSLLHIVTDLDGYEHRFGKGRPLLTIYKINGCAERYAEDAEGNAHQIILAERDLQNWHGQGWARTMFKDRLGQSSVVLTGFSGEEAQVRFDIKALHHDLGTIKSDLDPECLCCRPNAPFIQEYCGFLNRFQRQVMHVWIESRSDASKWKALSNEKREETILANTFTGSHCKFFREENAGLTADRFWEAVFIGVWRRLIEREFTDGPTAVFLRYLHVQFDTQGFIDALFDTEPYRCPVCSLIAFQADPDADSPLIRCIDESRPGARSPGNNHYNGRYYSVHEQGLVIGLFLLLLVWSNKEHPYFERHPDSDANLGLRLQRMSDGSLETWLAWSPHGEPPLNAEQGDLSRSQCEEPIVFIQIVANTPGQIYAPRVEPAKRIHRYGVLHGGEQYWRHGVRIDLGELLRMAVEEQHRLRNPHNGLPWEQFCTALDYVVDQPWVWFHKKRGSFRNRTTRVGAK